MAIANFASLVTNPARKQALLVAQAGLVALEPKQVFASAYARLIRKKLKSAKRVLIVGVGAASFVATKELAGQFKNIFAGAVVLDFEFPPHEPIRPNWQLIKITPHQTVANRAASERLKTTLQEFSGVIPSTQNNGESAVLFILGAEANQILCGDAAMAPDQERAVLELLIKNSARPTEIETVLRWLSPMRVGGLAALAFPSRVISIGVDNNPVQKETTTVYEAQDILQRYQILKALGVRAVSFAQAPSDNKFFANVTAIKLESPKIFAAASSRAAKKLGHKISVLGYDPATTPDLLQKQLSHEIYKMKSGQCLIAVPRRVISFQDDRQHLAFGEKELSKSLHAVQTKLISLVITGYRYFNDDPIGYELADPAEAKNYFYSDQPVLSTGPVFIFLKSKF